ncbi:Versicolorin reductase-like protein 3 [Diaporthe eres]|uniref:Uncharacterized protein n=1 Tax=Diaporthe vaccinii TaxID=105482 RepID=A0ABR4F4B6_9PEZI|nr:Versicolorin reductase-like protein 3 [Diaporthe eres]
MADKPSAPPSLAGRVAVVSGSSQGIGAAIARELSSRGAVLVLNHPDPSQLANAEAVRDSLPTEAIAVEADMSTVDGPAALISAAVARFGRVDILVNNAGRGDHTSLRDLTPERWAAVFDLNARGPALLTQAALPHLTPGGGSRIVNVVSPTSRDPPAPDWTLYGGSKGALYSMTRAWAKELPREYGCTVNAVAPGPVDGLAINSAPEEFKKGLAVLAEMTPVAPRLTQAAEVAWAVAMLCEEGAGWINGDIVNVSGGLHLL